MERTKKLFYFTLATGEYIGYINVQELSYMNFFPHQDIEKHFIIMTDQDFSHLSSEYIHYVKVPVTHYNIMCLFKLAYALYALDNIGVPYDPEKDMYMFMDADGYFMDREDKVWDYWIEKMQEYDLICNAYSNFYCKERIAHMVKEYAEPDPKYCGYFKITDKSVNICSNIFCGKLIGLKKVSDLIRQWCDHDFNVNIYNRHLPPVNEETFINKIVNDAINGENWGVSVMIEMMHAVPWNGEYPWYDEVGNIDKQLESWPNIIAVSKYDNSKKKKTMPNWDPPTWQEYKDYIDKVYLIETSYEGNKEKALEEAKSARIQSDIIHYMPLIENNLSSDYDDVTLSHYMAIKYALLDESLEKVMILETDCGITTDWRDFIEGFKSMDKCGDYDLGPMCGNLYTYEDTTILPASCYVINRMAMTRLVEILEKESNEFGIRTALYKLVSRVNTVASSVNSCIDRFLKTDIEYLKSLRTVAHYEKLEKEKQDKKEENE